MRTRRGRPLFTNKIFILGSSCGVLETETPPAGLTMALFFNPLITMLPSLIARRLVGCQAL